MFKIILFCAVFFGMAHATPAKNETKPLALGEVDGGPPSLAQTRVSAVVGTKGMIVADDAAAASWGVEILRRGGNAVDAAVATAFAMAVTRPHFASLGGGGFMIYCPAPPKTGSAPDCQALDYREVAPGAATRDMYVRSGKVDTNLSQNGALAAAVPGVTAGLLTALEKYGRLPRQVILRHPIELAKKGYPFTSYSERVAFERWGAMNDEAKKILGCKSGSELKPCAPGTKIIQENLAKVLESISAKGKAGFYEGWVARKMTSAIQKAGGIITEKDLAAYSPRFRAPVRGEFKDFEVVTMPPPSNGGVAILQMLGFAERAAKQGMFSQGYGSAAAIHALVHAMSLAFADRAEFFGDPDRVSVPIRKLLSAPYLDDRWKTFDASRAALPDKVKRIDSVQGEGQHTTHFSVIDREGNAVAITTTINDNYGSGFVPEGTGVFMNNEMDDFAIQPGVPNLFGLVGNESNAIEPGKKPLSSMSPTIVRDKQGNARIVLGAAGGPRITTAVFLALLNRLYFGMSLPDALSAGRFHHQWRPKDVFLERSVFPFEVRHQLESLGYALKEMAASARVYGLERFPMSRRVWGAPDARGEGAAIAE